MFPPAPARFSTMMLCPMFSESFLTMMRAVMSAPPPGAKPTTMLTGRLGKTPCASPNAGQANARTATRILGMISSWTRQKTVVCPRLLLDRDPRFLDHPAPGGVLSRHVLRELLGGRRRRFFALLEDRGVGVGIAQRFHHFAIQPGDDILRHLRG